MPKIQVFDPPMCCSTGVCGPEVDPALARFSADLEWLKAKGVAVERFNLAQQPAAFVENAVVAALMRANPDALPALLVDGKLASQGARPARAQLAALVGLAETERGDETVRAEKTPGGCCCSPSDAAPVTLSKPATPSKKCC